MQCVLILVNEHMANHGESWRIMANHGESWRIVANHGESWRLIFVLPNSLCLLECFTCTKFHKKKNFKVRIFLYCINGLFIYRDRISLTKKVYTISRILLTSGFYVNLKFRFFLQFFVVNGQINWHTCKSSSNTHSIKLT